MAKLLPGQVLLRDTQRNVEWIYDVDEEEYAFLKKRGTFDEDGALVLSMPLISGIKRFSVDRVLSDTEKYIKKMGVPNLHFTQDDLEDIDLGEIEQATNDQLEEYLAVFGGYRSYLESQLSMVEARRNTIEIGLEEGINRAVYTTGRGYKERGEKTPLKEALKGECFAESSLLRQTRADLIEIEAVCIRIRGMREAYKAAFETTSRIASLRMSSREQV